VGLDPTTGDGWDMFTISQRDKKIPRGKVPLELMLSLSNSHTSFYRVPPQNRDETIPKPSHKPQIGCRPPLNKTSTHCAARVSSPPSSRLVEAVRPSRFAEALYLRLAGRVSQSLTRLHIHPILSPTPAQETQKENLS
jgi:hypothetical protein